MPDGVAEVPGPSLEQMRLRVEADCNDFGAINDLALALIGRGLLDEAEPLARDAVRIAPGNAQAHNLMGMALTEAGRPWHGEPHYRRALELSGGRPPVLLANLAWSLKRQGRVTEARCLYEESIRLAPEEPQTWLGWIGLEEADRRIAEAARLLDRAEALFPGDVRFISMRAVLLGRMRRHEAAVEVLDGLEQSAGPLAPDQLLERGAALDRLGRFDDAFAAFDEAKRRALAATGRGYMADQAQNLCARLGQFFVAGRLAMLPRASVAEGGPQPVFILGFPRSGTTLVEQMLSCHPLISAGDELPFVAEIARDLPRLLGSPLGYPEALSELWMADHARDLDVLRDRYLREVGELGILKAGAAWFTDKMPLNETHMGLIALLFPRSPMIHMIRHPLDVVLSVFANGLTHGYGCAASLESAARHYVLVMDLVERYRREMPLHYLSVRYEDVVADPEGSLRGILSFVGAPFDPACLRFEDNPRHARTASYAQVAERLHSRSVGRHRHYMAHLGPILPILRPVMERLRYEAGG